MDLSDVRKRINAAKVKYDVSVAALEDACNEVISCETACADADDAQEIVQAVAETVQEEAHKRIAGVVSRCLETVFDEPYRFNINFERARGRTEAHLVFIRGEHTVNPIDASGGGVVDVAAFALRLASIMLARPPKRRLVILDEPFKFVSAEYKDRIRMMLEGLSEDLGVQFVMITHDEALCCGRILEVT